MNGINTIESIEAKVAASKPRSIWKHLRGDRFIWILVIILSVFSILIIYSSIGSLAFKKNRSAESYLLRQSGYVFLGFFIIYFTHRINYTFYSRMASVLFFLSIPLLIYTLKYGMNINDASRWIRLPVLNLTFETSDFAKLALFIYLSRILSRRQKVIKDFKQGFLHLMVPVVIICALIAPANLSTALLIGAISVVLMFIGRVNLKHLFFLGLGFAMLLGSLFFVASKYYDKETQTSKELPAAFDIWRLPTWIQRIQDFTYAKHGEESYQVQQSKIAIATGGILGKGPGKSQQRNFLPHPYSDFIYSVIIEEYGLLGGAAILVIYLLLFLRSIKIFHRCPYAFGSFLTISLSLLLVSQAIINMAVNVDLFPTTGVTLPLVSMGGSSLFFTCAAIGIILSVSRYVDKSAKAQQMAAAVAATAEQDENNIGEPVNDLADGR